MRVANYYRVSTTIQEKRFSLAAQKTELRAYAKRQEWDLISEFKDVESGGVMDKTGLNALLDLVEAGKIDVVLCMDQNRLSRLDTLSWEYLKSVLKEHSVLIAEPTGTLTDLSNEDAEFMSDLRNLMAQREKRTIVKQMMYGKRQRLREGKGWGIPPFEYRYSPSDGRYYIKDGWDWVIPYIDDLYINERIGMKSIANALNEISKTPTGKDWHENTVGRRLNSKAYHGIQEKIFSNGETISTPGIFEPMRTEETFNKITEIRKQRRVSYSINTRASDINIALLKYVPLTCGICERVVGVQQRGPVHAPRFYTQHGRSEVVDETLNCDLLINAKRYEYNLVKALRDILNSKELGEQYIDMETNDDELGKLKAKEKTGTENLKQLNQAKDRLLDLYLHSETEIKKEDYLKKEKELVNKIEVSTEQVEKTKRKIAAINKKEWSYENLYEYFLTIDNIGEDLNRHEQARMIGDIFVKGVLTDEELVLTTEIYNGIPVEVTIPIADNTWTVNKWMREDERNGNVIYKY